MEDMIFGIAPSREEYVDQRRRQVPLEAAKLFGPNAWAGAALAGVIAPPSPTEEMQKRMQAQEAAQFRMQDFMKLPEYKNLDQGAKSRYFRKLLAEESFRFGLHDIGSQLYSQIEQEQKLVAKQDADLEHVGVETDRARAATESTLFELGRAKMRAVRGEMAEIFPLGTSDPNTGRTAFIDDFGNAHSNGELIPLGKYTTARPQRPLAGSGRGGKLRDYYTPTELRGYRGVQRDVMAQMRAAVRIQNIMQQAFGESGSIDILGKAGGASSLATKIVDEVSAMGRAIQKAGGSYERNLELVDSKGKVVGKLDGTESSAQRLATRFSGIEFRIPPSIRKDETQARRYKAALINLAYAVARSEEPGNPRLSDDDFKRNLMQISDATTSPETLRQVLLDRIKTSHADYEIMTLQIPEELRKEANTPEANAAYESLYNEFTTIFSKPFGTAGRPGPGITEEVVPEDSQDMGDGFTIRYNNGG